MFLQFPAHSPPTNQNGEVNMKINPNTPVTLIARYTKGGAAGAFEGVAAWVSDNSSDTFDGQKDDPTAGVTQIVLHGTSSAGTSTPSVTADVQEGAGESQLGGKLAEPIEWTPEVVMLADGVTLEINLA